MPYGSVLGPLLFIVYASEMLSSLRTDYLPMQMTPHYWQLFASQQTDLLLLPSRDLARIQEWCNHWSMLLNPNKTKVLVLSKSKTVSPPDGDLVLSGVSIRASPYLDIHGLKFDSSSPSKTMCVVLFRMWHICGHLCVTSCYFAKKVICTKVIF